MTYIVLNASRDPRVEDPTNRWLFDPVARLLVPLAVRLRISANTISISGVFVGALAALAYERWQQPGAAALGFLFSLVWLVMDSLDGMVARATGTSSAFGRQLDGYCDHCVFTLLYIALAGSVGGVAVWSLMLAAGAAHAVQASLYEGERERFNRRRRGIAPPVPGPRSRNPATRLYDWLASSFDRASAPFDRALAAGPSGEALRQRYCRKAIPVFQAMLPLSQNMRLFALFLACLSGWATAFLWFELIPLSALTAIGILQLRRVETTLLR